MISSEHINVLRQIKTQLANTDIDWVVTGSLALALQGVPVEVRDIDIHTDEQGAYGIESLFSDYVQDRVAPSYTQDVRSYHGKLVIDGIEVEIIGDIQKRCEDGTWEDLAAIEHHKRVVAVVGMAIPVFSLEYEYQAYLRLGREKRAQVIKEWMTREQKQ